MSVRLFLPLDQVPAAERAAHVEALAADLARRLEALFPGDENYRRSLVVAPVGSFEEARGLLELRVTHGRGWGLRVRLDPAEGPAVRVLAEALPPWIGRAFAAVSLVAALAAGAAGAYGWWHANRITALVFMLVAFLAVATAGLLLLLPLRWHAARAHRADVERVALELDAALAALRAADPRVGAPRRAWSPAAVWGATVVVTGGLSALTATLGLSPDVDTGWLCLLAPLAALLGCMALAFLVKFAMAVLGLAEGGRLDADDEAVSTPAP